MSQHSCCCYKLWDHSFVNFPAFHRLMPCFFHSIQQNNVVKSAPCISPANGKCFKKGKSYKYLSYRRVFQVYSTRAHAHTLCSIYWIFSGGSRAVETPSVQFWILEITIEIYGWGWSGFGHKKFGCSSGHRSCSFHLLWVYLPPKISETSCQVEYAAMLMVLLTCC